MRFIQDLSPETQSILRRLHKQSQHHRVRQRAHCILLSFQGMTTNALMKVFAVERLTLYNWFNAWDTRRLAGLYDHKGRGRPPKLTLAEQEQVQQYIEQHPKDMKKVAHLIEQETSKRVSTKTIKRLLKKANYIWKRIKKSDTLHERPKVVDSLPGYTSGMAGCRHNLVTRTTCSMRLSVSTDGTIRPLQRPLVGDCSLKRL